MGIYNHKASQVRVNQIQYSASHPLRKRQRKTITMTLPKTTMSNCRWRKCLSSDYRGCKTRESLDRPQAQLKHTHTHGSSLHPNGQEPTNGASVRNVPDTLDKSTPRILNRGEAAIALAAIVTRLLV